MPTYVYRCPIHNEFEVEQRITDAKLTVCPMTHWGVSLGDVTDYGDEAANKRWRSAKYSACAAPSAEMAGKKALEHYARVYPARVYVVVGVDALLEETCQLPVERLIAGGTSFALKGSGWAKDGYR